MDIMPTVGKLNAEFGSHHSAAAVRWITGDTNAHDFPDSD
jgi:hypothetical protein